MYGPLRFLKTGLQVYEYLAALSDMSNDTMRYSLLPPPHARLHNNKGN